MDPNTEICVTCGGTEAMMAAVPGSSFFKEPVNHLIRMHFARGTDVLDEAVRRLAKLTELLKVKKRTSCDFLRDVLFLYREIDLISGLARSVCK